MVAETFPYKLSQPSESEELQGYTVLVVAHWLRGAAPASGCERRIMGWNWRCGSRNFPLQAISAFRKRRIVGLHGSCGSSPAPRGRPGERPQAKNCRKTMPLRQQAGSAEGPDWQTGAKNKQAERVMRQQVRSPLLISPKNLVMLPAL